MKKIAVQKGLNTVKDYLNNNGYNVEEIDTTEKNTGDLSRFDAVVLTGMDDNLMGIDTTTNKIPMINADGMSPEDVKNTIEGTK